MTFSQMFRLADLVQQLSLRQAFLDSVLSTEPLKSCTRRPELRPKFPRAVQHINLHRRGWAEVLDDRPYGCDGQASKIRAFQIRMLSNENLVLCRVRCPEADQRAHFVHGYERHLV